MKDYELKVVRADEVEVGDLAFKNGEFYTVRDVRRGRGINKGYMVIDLGGSNMIKLPVDIVLTARKTTSDESHGDSVHPVDACKVDALRGFVDKMGDMVDSTIRVENLEQTVSDLKSELDAERNLSADRLATARKWENKANEALERANRYESELRELRRESKPTIEDLFGVSVGDEIIIHQTGERKTVKGMEEFEGMHLDVEPEGLVNHGEYVTLQAEDDRKRWQRIHGKPDNTPKFEPGQKLRIVEGEHYGARVSVGDVVEYISEDVGGYEPSVCVKVTVTDRINQHVHPDAVEPIDQTKPFSPGDVVQCVDANSSRNELEHGKLYVIDNVTAIAGKPAFKLESGGLKYADRFKRVGKRMKYGELNAGDKYIDTLDDDWPVIRSENSRFSRFGADETVYRIDKPIT